MSVSFDKKALKARWYELETERAKYVETVMDPLRKKLDEFNTTISDAQKAQEPVRNEWVEKNKKLVTIDEERANIARALGRRGLVE